jgi:uncharacterized phiE125 gp8 family phage protein
MIVYSTSVPSVIEGDPIRVDYPIVSPVSLEEATAQTRVDADETMIARLINVATDIVEDYTGLALITQTYEQSFYGHPEVLTLRKRPLQAVTSIEDPVAILDPSVYTVYGAGAPRRPAVVRPAASSSWPLTAIPGGGWLRVVYRAGFGDDASTVPEMIRHAVLLVITMLYDNRDLPDLGPVHALLADWRKPGIA